MQYVAFGIKGSDPNVVAAFSKDVSEGGIFLLPEATKSRIKSVGLRGCAGPQKIMHFIGYLSELAYDLAICHDDNISTSPGFEPCLLNFTRK